MNTQPTIHAITVPDSHSIYPNRDGSRSTVAAVAKVAIMPGVIVDASIYAKVAADGTVGFRASLPRKGLSFAKDVADAIRDYAESEVADWGGWEKAADAAVAAFNAPATSSTAGQTKLASKLGQSKLAAKAPVLVAKPATQPAK